ncbi:MAG: serine/threonine-protein kinase [Candidatus Melainabacteria bacterium]|nr:serine/threonine-protein kinase [Candidatus Melainabacteria bacterium]
MNAEKRFEITIPVKESSKIKAGAFYTSWAIFGLVIGYVMFEISASLAGLDKPHATLIRVAHFIISLLGGLAYVYVPYLYALSRTQGQTVLVNEDGCGFPSSFFGIGAAQWVPWSEVKTVDISPGLFGTSQLALSGSRHKQQVQLSAVSEQDMEQMLLAIEAWAPSAVLSTRVQEYRDGLQRENLGSEGFSHTQMFEDELGKRFSAPTFVPLEPGRQLRSGTIRVIRQLAFGGFAAVYLAEDSVNGTVVLKESVVPESQNESIREKASEMFAREAITLRRLDHPGIARVYDFFVEDNRSYIVMEHVNGINMRQLVAQQGRQSEANVLAWASTVSEILTYLHEQSPPVVHRDVTPDNLVLTNLGEVKLIDFGASNQYLGTATGTLVGKHAYMPPEQIRGKSEPASDIFALGATMHYWLTGLEPEPLSTSHPAQIKPDVSAELDRIVAAATHMEVGKRIPTAAALNEELKRASSDLGSVKLLQSKSQ